MFFRNKRYTVVGIFLLEEKWNTYHLNVSNYSPLETAQHPEKNIIHVSESPFLATSLLQDFFRHL
jgi:hypothetical protein